MSKVQDDIAVVHNVLTLPRAPLEALDGLAALRRIESHIQSLEAGRKLHSEEQRRSADRLREALAKQDSLSDLSHLDSYYLGGPVTPMSRSEVDERNAWEADYARRTNSSD